MTIKQSKKLVGLWNIPEMIKQFKEQGLNDREAEEKTYQQILQSFKNFEKNNS